MSAPTSEEIADCLEDVRAMLEHLQDTGIYAIDLPARAPVGEGGRRAPPSDVGRRAPAGTFSRGAERGASPPPDSPPPPNTLPAGPTWKKGGAAQAPPPRPAQPLDLPAVRQELGDCTRCGLCRTRGQLAFGEGGAGARILFLLDVPEAEYDARGALWEGEVGVQLARVVEGMFQLTPADVYVTHLVKCRPPEGRPPTPDEMASCRPTLEAQIRAVAPRVVVAMGALAAGMLLGRRAPLDELRGRWHDALGIAVRATVHPREIATQPERKRAAFDDLREVKRFLTPPQ